MRTEADGHRPLSFLEARGLAEQYAGQGEHVHRFWRDGDVWRVQYARERRATRGAQDGALVIVPGREEIVGPVRRP